MKTSNQLAPPVGGAVDSLDEKGCLTRRDGSQNLLEPQDKVSGLPRQSQPGKKAAHQERLDVAGQAPFFIEAVDGAADGRRKLIGSFHRSPCPPRLVGLFTSVELGLAVGGENVIHSAFLAGRGAERWAFEVERLAGFRPLFPESWREEP